EVSVLNGGFKNWVKEGHPVTADVTQPTPAVFKARLNRALVKTFEEMVQNVSSLNFQVVDSRLESGHIPGAVNIPFHSFLSETGHEKSIEEIQEIFRAKKVDLLKPLTATCRKGVTACQIALAAFLCGKRDVAVYDGSWSEWFHRAPPHYKVSESKRSKA
ncbi:THTR sulfurtransferase, partial [Malurus elegans]|nr:THTR sulfurtransferase [Malurus elegans]